MRIGILSDIHGNHLALEAVLSPLKQVDALVFAGDISGYYPFVKECLEILSCCRLLAVRGNHDQELLNAYGKRTTPSADYHLRYGSALTRAMDRLTTADYSLIQGWPSELDLVLGGYAIKVMHGAPWDTLNGRIYPDYGSWEGFEDIEADIIIMGHTHYPLVKRLGGKLIINPGSVGQARDVSGKASCAILDLQRWDVQLIQVPYDRKHLIADAVNHDPHLPYLVEVLQR